MKIYIKSDSSEDGRIAYDDIKNLIFSMKHKRELNYDKISQLTKGMRLAYVSDKIRDDDFAYLQSIDIPGVSDITTDNSTDRLLPKTPFYIRLKISDDITPSRKEVDLNDFQNIDPQDVDIIRSLAEYKIIPTFSTSAALRNNSNYKDSDKYIELIKRNATSRTYRVPYDRYDFRGDRIYVTDITIYDDGSISIDRNKPLMLSGNITKLARQFKMSHW